MRKLMLLIAAVVTSVFASSPAFAQATRTWVSGVGDDVNPCSRTAPCKTFPGAISKTATGGEINCLDPGGFGTLNITKSISVVCDHTEGGVLASGVNAFIVNAPAGSIVTLKGLDIECIGTGVNGIELIGVGVTLHVHKIQARNCRGNPGNGVLIAPSSGTAVVDIADSYLTDNTVGVEVKPTGSGNARVTISRVIAAANATGFRGNGTTTTGTINMAIVDSVATGNSGAGINATTPAGGGQTTQIMVDRSVSSNNGTFGIRADGAGATVRFGSSSFAGNQSVNGTITTNNSATVSSYGNNQINGNVNDAPNPPTIPLH